MLLVLHFLDDDIIKLCGGTVCEKCDFCRSGRRNRFRTPAGWFSAAAEKPEAKIVGDGHAVRCFRYEEVQGE